MTSSNREESPPPTPSNKEGPFKAYYTLEELMAELGHYDDCESLSGGFCNCDDDCPNDDCCTFCLECRCICEDD